MIPSITSSGLPSTIEATEKEIDSILNSPKTNALNTQIVALLKSYKQLSSSEIPSDIKSRVTAWLRQPASVVETSKAISSTFPQFRPSPPTKEPIKSTIVALEVDLESREIQPQILLLTYETLNKKYFGIPASTLPEIVQLTLEFIESWGDLKAKKLLVDALDFLGGSDPKLQEAFENLFEHMVEQMNIHEHFVDPVYVLGLQACRADKLDLLFKPLEKSLSTYSAPMEKKHPLINSSKEKRILIVTDTSSLERAYEEGCLAGCHMAQTTVNSCLVTTKILINIINYTSDCCADADIRGIEMRFNEKIISAVKKLEQDPFCKKIREVNRISIYLQKNSFFKALLKAENSLSELKTHFREYILAQVEHYVGISNELRILSRIDGTDEKLPLQFSLIKTHYNKILTINSQLLYYLEEIEIKANHCMHYRTLSLLLDYLPYDRSVDWDEVSSKGLLHYLTQYRKTDSNIDYASMPRHVRPLLVENKVFLDNLTKSLNIFIALVRELKKTHESAQNQSKDPLVTLGALVKDGLISQTASGEISFNLPTKEGVIDDGFENTLLLTGLPCLRPTTSEKLSPSALREETTSDPAELAPRDFTEEPLDPTSIPEALSGLNHILLEARSNNKITTTQGKQAFFNALHYADSLCALLADLDRSTPQSWTLAIIQQDIATTSFYACEQLLTAILHEKRQAPAEGSSKDLYKDLRHSLMGRFLEAGLSQRRELQQILPILRSLEGIGAAVLDPFSNHIPHLLLQNIPSLMSKGTMEANPFEIKRVLFSGQESLQAFFYLLSLGGMVHKFTTSNISRYLQVLSSNFIPLESMERKKATVVYDRAAGGGAKTSPETRPIDEMLSIIGTALDPSQVLIITEARRPALMHNLNRVKYFRGNLADQRKSYLLPFYANQIRFVLRNVLEEFLCAACEKTIASFDQIAARHDLNQLAGQTGILTSLSADERNFLLQSAGVRNEARYGFKIRAPSLMRPTAEGLARAAEAEEEPEEFIEVTSRDYERTTRLIDREIAMAMDLCRKIAQHSFSEK